MKIGELSRQTGVSVRALRYYEEKGALKPERTPSGYRTFHDADVQTVEHIQALLAAGLRMDLITEIVSCIAGESLLLEDCRDRLLHERRRMTDDIDRIDAARSMLDRLLTDPSLFSDRTARLSAPVSPNSDPRGLPKPLARPASEASQHDSPHGRAPSRTS
ncbi:MAG: MerR family transcriptional regulator [Kutzneria sp.]|nr:MerR family transcriptional regulator [Kutzneria sp.]MBV9845210.1 MerR family transcriptional regulator [Kutzneria sp.]